MSLRAIVQKVGGDLYDRESRANIPAPGHSKRDRSVSLLLAEGRVVAHAFNGVDWRLVLDDLRKQGLIDARNAPCSVSGSVPAPPPPGSLPRPERLVVARRYWDSGRPAARTLSERHLRLRNIRRPTPGPDVIRHSQFAPISAYTPGRSTKPAMLAAISDPAGALAAVEITYLDPNGRRATGLRLSRKTVGNIPSGCAIRIDPAAERMLVGEGLMTTLSASERFGLPAWALLSTSNLRRWSPPHGVRAVLIAADRGEDGEASANILADRLRDMGVRAAIRLPPGDFGDWNDAAPR